MLVVEDHVEAMDDVYHLNALWTAWLGSTSLRCYKCIIAHVSTDFDRFSLIFIDFHLASLEINENLRKSVGNRPKRRVRSYGHLQVDRNATRASPSPNKVEYRVSLFTMRRWSDSMVLFS